MPTRHYLPRLLLALNWIALLAAFAWTCKTQGNLLWWLRLDWAGWLREFAALAELGAVPAGSIWLMWLALSLFWPVVARLSDTAAPPAAAAPAEPSADKARRQLAPASTLIEARPELRDKLLKLHQSLDRL